MGSNIDNASTMTAPRNRCVSEFSPTPPYMADLVDLG
jgi:hypothetical protein